MRSRIRAAKQRATAGETLVETLVAILIGSLAVLMLAQAVATAVGVIDRGNVASQRRYAREASLFPEDADPVWDGANGEVTISYDGVTRNDPVAVHVYGDEEALVNGSSAVSRYVEVTAP